MRQPQPNRKPQRNSVTRLEEETSRMAGEGGDRVNLQQNEAEETYEGFNGLDEGLGGLAERESPDEPGFGRRLGTDERIRKEVCDRIAQNARLDARDVAVTVNDGVVTLSGTVPEATMKWELEGIAELVKGVIDVHVALKLKKEE